MSIGAGIALVLSLAWAAALADVAKFGVDRTGLQVVTGAQLQEAGVELDALDPPRIGLRCGSDTVALRIVGLEDGRLSAASRLIFYGQALDTRFTDTNVYWLSSDGQHVARMEELQAAAAEGEPPKSFPTSLRLELNKVYAYLIGDTSEGELRPWFWGIVKPDGAFEVLLDLPNLADPQAPATLRAGLRARTSDPKIDPDHHVVATINGVQTEDLRFDGPKWIALDKPIPPGTLVKGRNSLVFSCTADTGSDIPEQVYLDWVELEYERDFAASNTGLEVFATADAPRTIEVAAVKAETIDWYNLSDPLRPTVAAGVPTADGRVRLALGPKGTHYAAVPPESYGSVAWVQKATPPRLKAGESGADYLIVAHEDLIEAIQPLAEYRRKQGLRVEVVPVNCIYDEFSAGVFTPYAIRDFVAYALAEWQPRPQYLLLVGDASYDYRDYTNTGFGNLVPTVMARESGSIEVACDAAFAVDAETGALSLAVGRFPASTPEQVQKLVQTTIAFEKLAEEGAHSKTIVFVADQEGFGPLAHRFDRACELWADRAVEAGFVVQKFYQTHVGLTEDQDRDARITQTREALTPGLVESLRDGPFAVFFMGHGDEYFWGYNKLLMADDLKEFQPAGASLYIQDTCFSGGFDVPGGRESISEALLWCGASVACYAPSRLGGNDVQSELLRELLQGNAGRLGQAVLKARQARRLRLANGFWVSGSNFNLFGDPALKVGAAAEPGAE
jgi:hypothetical protein